MKVSMQQQVDENYYVLNLEFEADRHTVFNTGRSCLEFTIFNMTKEELEALRADINNLYLQLVTNPTIEGIRRPKRTEEN